jgi:prepilin-type N-terminal cleavage/methylation domain-containing protein
MVPGRLTALGADGFSLAELLVVVGIIGVLAVAGAPYFIEYWQSQKLRAGAEELATIVNQGRQLAITNNTRTCVRRVGDRVRLIQGTATPCTSGTVWIGPGTDAAGDLTLTEGLQVSATTADVVFNYLGAATTTGTYTVRNPTNGRALFVKVASSGRVCIVSAAGAAC